MNQYLMTAVVHLHRQLDECCFKDAKRDCQDCTAAADALREIEKFPEFLDVSERIGDSVSGDVLAGTIWEGA